MTRLTEIPVPGRMLPNAALLEARTEFKKKSSGFGRVEFDFGAAKGKFLTESALANPSCFHAGIEGLALRVERTNKKLRRLGISNAAVWRGWGREALEMLVPEGTLDTLHGSFPDPWPKRSHWPRRLVNREFLATALTLLKPHGVLRLMTDHPGYFESMMCDIEAHGEWKEVSWDDGFKRPVTEFETIFLAKGDPIDRIAVTRIQSYPM